MNESAVFIGERAVRFQGIWIRDIRFKSNLGMTQLNKLLKTMEGKKLIKSVTSVAVSLYRTCITALYRIDYLRCRNMYHLSSCHHFYDELIVFDICHVSKSRMPFIDALQQILWR